jgi:hypothetical protein
MAANKYGKYIVSSPVEKGEFGVEQRYIGEELYKSNFSLVTICVTEPVLMEKTPHYHDFDMYLYFLSYDPNNLDDLGAEIEMGFGKEGERHIITKPSSVFVPKGTIHCPLHFKKVTKPILFVHPMMAPKYSKIEL